MSNAFSQTFSNFFSPFPYYPNRRKILCRTFLFSFPWYFLGTRYSLRKYHRFLKCTYNSAELYFPMFSFLLVLSTISILIVNRFVFKFFQSFFIFHVASYWSVLQTLVSMLPFLYDFLYWLLQSWLLCTTWRSWIWVIICWKAL